jgi:Spy/CpxP family protein refolding chaperone
MKTTSNKILTIAVVLLLLVNVAMLVFMLKGRGHHDFQRRDGRGEAFEMMVKELNMTEQQQTDFKKMKAEHFKNIGPVFDSIKTLKKSLFDLVRAETINDSIVSKYSSLIAEQQALVDKATINHFRQVRALFAGDQQKKFDDFVQKMMQRRMAGPGGMRGKDSTGRD